MGQILHFIFIQLLILQKQNGNIFLSIQDDEIEKFNMQQFVCPCHSRGGIEFLSLSVLTSEHPKVGFCSLTLVSVNQMFWNFYTVLTF